MRLLLAVAVVVPALLTAIVFMYLPVWVGFGDVVAALKSREALYAIRLSLLTAAISSILALIAAIPAAYALSRGLVPFGRALETLLLLPFGMPPVAVGASLLVFLSGPGSPIDDLLGIVLTPRGLVVAQLAIVYPMSVRVLKTSFDSVDPRYEAVARTLGHGWLSTMIHVVIPMAWRGLVTALLLAFMRSLGEFGASVMLAGATRLKTETLPIAIYLAINGGDVSLGVALIGVSALAAGASVAALLFLERGHRGNS